MEQFDRGLLEGEILGVCENLVGVSVVDNIFVTPMSRDNDDRAMVVQCLAIGFVDFVRSSYFTGNMNDRRRRTLK
jgi:hypothetical protein